jgi:hypothetical protein
MPKLIRLLGDVNKSNTEISNTFRQPLIIKKNSRVGLTGLSAFMADDLGNSVFQINGDGDGEFFISIPTAGADIVSNATVSAGTYDKNTFALALEAGANASGLATDDSTIWGLDHKCSLLDNTLTITSALSVAAFTDGDFNVWEQFGSPINISGTNDNAFDTTGNVGNSSIILEDQIPRVHNYSQWKLATQEGVAITIAARASINSATTYGIKTETNIYKKIFSNVVSNIVDSTNATVATEDGDTVKMEVYAGTVLITIEDAAGDGKGAGNAGTPGEYLYTNAISKAENNLKLYWTMLVAPDAVIEDVQYQTLADNTNKTALCGLKFVTSNKDIPNAKLASFCGFGGQLSLISYEGNPAILKAPEPLLGLNAFGSILVTLDGVGKIASFDGSALSKSADNILYVLNTPASYGQYIQVDVANIFYLDLDNSVDLNVNQLRVRFLSGAGYQSKERVLKFLGNPSVSILIDDSPR